MKRAKILWADDEIDLLKPYILFLSEKGFEVVKVNNGRDAIELCSTQSFDIVFMDEHMPGISGLDAVSEISKQNPDIPIVMITKSEDEGIMEQAIGRKIADYLIKPVNPHQILLAIKKILDQKEIISEKSLKNYREEFGKLNDDINNCSTPDGWIDIYKRISAWDLSLDSSGNDAMVEILQMQKTDANTAFAKFVRSNYGDWFNPQISDKPLMSHNLFAEKVYPLLDSGEKVFFILVDNFRFDQWIAIKPLLTDFYQTTETLYYSILPTATQYARNAIFAGKTPLDISHTYPKLWKFEDDDLGKNLSEDELLTLQMREQGRGDKMSYRKINSNIEGERLLSEFASLEDNDLNVVVFNFIDILSHARNEQKMLQELVPNEAAYRSLTYAWFRHSPLLELMRKVAQKGYKVIFTTDHGTIRIKKPLKVIADKHINSNLRYKVGRNLTFDSRKVFDVSEPEKVGLPSQNLSSRYIFALNDSFFAYPNNYNNYISTYENSFQHGGVSLEEMIVPFVELTPK